MACYISLDMTELENVSCECSYLLVHLISLQDSVNFYIKGQDTFLIWMYLCSTPVFVSRFVHFCSFVEVFVSITVFIF